MRKMNRATAAILAVLFGLATVLVFRWSLQKREAESAAAPAQVDVVAARVPIPPRTIVRPEMLMMKKVPRDEAPPDAVRTLNRAVDMATTVAVEPDDILRETDLSQKSNVLGLAYDIPPSMRAVSVSVDPVSGVSGFLKPGDRVDVLATYTSPQNELTVTRTVLQDIRLLAIGSQPASTASYKGTGAAPPVSGRERATEAQPEATTATLAVFPDQAQTLAMAVAKAKLHLVLRPPDDQAVRPMPGVTNTRVFGLPVRPVEAPPAPKPQPVVAAPAPAAPALLPMPMEPRPAAPPARPAEKPIVVVRGTEQSTVTVP
jgi:pilus assembly protein CpaB